MLNVDAHKRQCIHPSARDRDFKRYRDYSCFELSEGQTTRGSAGASCRGRRGLRSMNKLVSKFDALHGYGFRYATMPTEGNGCYIRAASYMHD